MCEEGGCEGIREGLSRRGVKRVCHEGVERVCQQVCRRYDRKCADIVTQRVSEKVLTSKKV